MSRSLRLWGPFSGSLKKATCLKTQPGESGAVRTHVAGGLEELVLFKDSLWQSSGTVQGVINYPLGCDLLVLRGWEAAAGFWE